MPGQDQSQPSGAQGNNSPRNSCLITKLSHFVRVSNAEQALIMSLEETEKECRRNDTIWRQGDQADSMHVVKSGWMYGYSILPDGRKQVLDIYCPGDVLGLRDIVFDYSVGAVGAATDAILCPFPKSAMDDIFVASPRIATLLYSLGMLENIVVIDRLRSVARLNARERLCHFLLQMQGRLRITNPNIGNTFSLPLTQELIANAIGLTPVHLNRTMKLLTEEGLISKNERRITLLEFELMRNISGYEDRHYKIDTSWFPKVTR